MSSKSNFLMSAPSKCSVFSLNVFFMSSRGFIYISECPPRIFFMSSRGFVYVSVCPPQILFMSQHVFPVVFAASQTLGSDCQVRDITCEDIRTVLCVGTWSIITRPTSGPSHRHVFSPETPPFVKTRSAFRNPFIECSF